jgi:hypothetical protein
MSGPSGSHADEPDCYGFRRTNQEDVTLTGVACKQLIFVHPLMTTAPVEL